MRITKNSLFLALLALCAAALVAGCNGAENGKGAAQAAQTPEVGVVTLAKEPVTLTTTLPGRTAAHLIAEVRPQVGGILEKRLFTEGGDVKAGQVLYRIDPAPYQAAYDQAKANLAQAEANLVPLKLKAERYADLIRDNAVSRQDYEDAEAAAKQAEALIQADKAVLDTAAINLGYTKITAPISGHIGRSSVTEGALLTADQATALATVRQLDPIYVDVTQSSVDMLRLKRDMASGRLKSAGKDQAEVRLLLEDGTSYAHTGKLQFSEVAVDQSTGAVTLRAIFPNPDHLLLPGMYVRAVLEEGVDESAILAPQQGVTHDTKGRATALVVTADDTVEQRILTVDRAMGDKWLVTSGLAAGDRLVVDGLQRVRPGIKVRPVPATLPAAPKQAEHE
ncbi:efflux transporter, RND family, MFP subunit [Desulfovibrio sp. X2]|uniref:efflux RND transporter periplasmic adaptor subunit n=1 Tax=Desulfovibrio sp. X2 TaxID=941449 RepID=UPI000358C58D|nr:efflux RND transporter periplasmic adaptor subunit [Desulfovibrio sp. X2]EPR38725.1 efflux transporter, RND family, MFP subunit [Desulfovibrio sp. X2]